MNAKTYQRCKQAHLLLINGCGEDCLNCTKPTCICDDPQIQADADRWAAQKEHERKYYRTHREKRLKDSNDYHRRTRPAPRATLRWVVVPETFDQLPSEFTYDEAAKVWQVTKTAAVERINKFLKLDPNCLVKIKTGRRCGLIKLRKI